MLTRSRHLLDWLLVLLLALSPMQGAWSALDNRCQHEQDNKAAANAPQETHAGMAAAQQMNCDRKLSRDMLAGTAPTAHDCCCHAPGHDGKRCSGNCQPVPLALYIPPLKATLAFTSFNSFETAQPDLNRGRTVSPPPQPPRS